jgi:hypothetical protein
MLIEIAAETGPADGPALRFSPLNFRVPHPFDV